MQKSFQFLFFLQKKKKKKELKRFLQRILQEIMKKIVIHGTSDAWLVSRLSQRTSEAVYYVID